MNNPTIVIKYQCQESMEWMPDVYIKEFKDAICAVNSKDRLNEIRLELKSMTADVENRIDDIDDPGWRKRAAEKADTYE